MNLLAATGCSATVSVKFRIKKEREKTENFFSARKMQKNAQNATRRSKLTKKNFFVQTFFYKAHFFDRKNAKTEKKTLKNGFFEKKGQN